MQNELMSNDDLIDLVKRHYPETPYASHDKRMERHLLHQLADRLESAVENAVPKGRYWGKNYVEACSACGVAPFNVDDCGHFGDPECPCFGIGREAYDEIFKKSPNTGVSGEA